MKLTLKELNEMYYCLNIAITHYSEHKLLDADAVNALIDKVRDEIDVMIDEVDEEDHKASLQQDEQRYENQHEHDILTSPSYREWWEQNKERILAEDKLNHEMQFKSSYAKHGDY